MEEMEKVLQELLRKDKQTNEPRWKKTRRMSAVDQSRNKKRNKSTKDKKGERHEKERTGSDKGVRGNCMDHEPENRQNNPAEIDQAHTTQWRREKSRIKRKPPAGEGHR